MKPTKTCFILMVLVIVISLFLSDPAQAQGTFIRGDINCDGVVDTVDLRLWQFDIPWVNCPNRKDIDDDGDVTAGDSIYLSNYLFFGGPPPPHPFPTCGFDTTPGLYSCNTACCCTVTVECNDGVDNDGDGLVDISNDCGCSSGCDSTEAPNLVRHCNDGIDNDGDGLIDLADTNCADICDNTEASIICIHKPCDARDIFLFGPGDGKWTLIDIIRLVGMVYKGAMKPTPLCRADCNASGGNPTLSDIVYLVNKVFKGGPDPLPVGECCKD